MDSEQSFNAILSMLNTRVNLLERLHGKPAMATISAFSGGFFTGKPQTQDHSHLLGMRAEDQGARSEPLRLHFRHTAGGYLLTIKNTGEHYNKLLSKSWLEVFGASDPTLATRLFSDYSIISTTSSHARTSRPAMSLSRS
ncbi:hypothetical protein [Pseudomonas ogarae]|uniref:hypothetical protein n=1 Tax=Pseudomonas ogarae (strain DSM 112162 / CECT 30235 / F113) TaxID=1114970 RepID=UPI001F31EFE5|nr:hypothetical protein [Pseudomonas ogarae]